MTDRDPGSRHYDVGGIEVQDVIKAKLTKEQYNGWLLGNVIKYSLRANFKGCFDRDIEKLNYYSRWLRDELFEELFERPDINASKEYWVCPDIEEMEDRIDKEMSNAAADQMAKQLQEKYGTGEETG